MAESSHESHFCHAIGWLLNKKKYFTLATNGNALQPGHQNQMNSLKSI